MEETSQSELTDPISSSQVLIIRHARSKFNQQNISLASIKADGVEFYNNACDPNMIDTDLCDEGIQECKLAHDIAMNMKIHTVFVSPFRRTLQTALYIFRGSLDKEDTSGFHPDFENIKFVVVPKLREKFKCTCDISKGFDGDVSQYFDLFPNLNTELLNELNNKNYFFFEDIDRAVFEEINPKIEPNETCLLGSNLVELLQEKIKITFPKDIETWENTLLRSKAVKKFISAYLRAHNLHFGDQSDKLSKVIIVSHNGYITMHQEVDHDSESMISLFRNCQFYPDITDYSEF